YFDPCSSIRASFTWFDNGTHGHLEAPDGSFIHSLVVAPNTTTCDMTSLAATAALDIGFKLADVDFRHIFCQGPHCAISWVAGIRYAHLNQDFSSDFSILGTTNVTTHINFDGVGPRVGLEGEYGLGRGFLVYGRGIVNLLAGHFGADFLQQNTF